MLEFQTPSSQGGTGRRRGLLFVAIVLLAALFDPYISQVGSLVAYATRYALCLAFILSRTPRRASVSHMGTVARSAVALCILITASVAWAPQPVLAAASALDLWALTLVALVAARNDFIWIVRWLAVAANAVVIGSVASIALDPAERAYDEYGRVALHGMLVNENEFGRLMIVCAVIVLFAASILRRPAFVVTGTAALVAAAFSGSAQVIVVGALSLGAGLLFAVANRLRDERRTVLWLALFPAGCAAAFLVANVSAVLSYLGRDSSLTNRVPLWEGVVAAMDGHWLLGYGVNSIWRGSRLQYQLAEVAGFLPAQAHNSFLEFTLQVGLAGGVIVGLLLAAAFARGIRTKSQAGTFMVVLSLCLGLYSLSASVFGQTPCDVYWLIVVATGSSLAQGSVLGSGVSGGHDHRNSRRPRSALKVEDRDVLQEARAERASLGID